MVILQQLAALIGFATFFTPIVAQLSVISPGGPNLWWVAKSQNVLIWSCKSSTYDNFTILIANPSPTILPAPLAIIGIEYNYICSQEITQDMANQPPATGYTIQFANPLNSTDIYAESQPFEIKPLGATYPPASATPTEGVTSGTSSGTAGGPSSTSKSSASGMKNSIVYGASAAAAAAAAVFGLITA